MIHINLFTRHKLSHQQRMNLWLSKGKGGEFGIDMDILLHLKWTGFKPEHHLWLSPHATVIDLNNIRTIPHTPTKTQSSPLN